jgi:HAMP domain-containing protein
MRSPRQLSLEFKLPVFIIGIIALVVLALALLAMREVRLGAEGRAEARLLDLSEQFATASATSTQRRTTVLASAVRGPEVIAALRDPSPRSIEAARAALSRLPADSTVLGLRLRDASDSVLLLVGDSITLGRLEPPARADSVVMVGPLVKTGDTVAYATSVTIRDGSRTLGRVVQWRRVALSAQGREAFTRFIGSDAQLYFGNAAGDLWVDMAGRVVQHPVDPAPGTVMRFEREGTQQLGVIRALPGTPWLMAIDIPMSYVMAQPRAFLTRFALVSLLLLVLGGLLAIIMSRRITKPLQELTLAAERLAAGDYGQSIDDLGTDEIGRLARAFRIMSLRVQDNHRQLEADVADRQREIRSTYEKLEAALDARPLPPAE